MNANAPAVRVLAPVVLGVVTIGLWQLVVDAFDIDPFIVPSPHSIWSQFVENRGSIDLG